jgi:hypothetical protein
MLMMVGTSPHQNDRNQCTRKNPFLSRARRERKWARFSSQQRQRELLSAPTAARTFAILTLCAADQTPRPISNFYCTLKKLQNRLFMKPRSPNRVPLLLVAKRRTVWPSSQLLKDATARVVADLAEKMLEDGYIHFDDRPSDTMTMRIRATIGVVPKDKVLPVKEQMEQLEAKLTCMCGSDASHSCYEGHSPVSMYDYSLSRAEEENERLKARVAQLENRLEEVFP